MGFGVRIHPTGGKVYVAQARGPNGQKRVTVERHPLIGAEQERQRAALIITRQGWGGSGSPAARGEVRRRPDGGRLGAALSRRPCRGPLQAQDRSDGPSVVNRHIVPALGRLPLAAVERRHVMELHESLCETPAMANMTVATLTHMYALARDWSMAPKTAIRVCTSR